MRVIDLALKDLLQIFRDWRAALFLIIMPIAFTMLFGFAFGGFGGPGEDDPRLPVILSNLDGGNLSLQLVGILEGSAVIRIESGDEVDREAHETSVEDGDAAALIIIPEGFSQGMLSSQPAPLTIVTDPVENAGRTVEGVVSAATMRLNNAIQTADISSSQASSHVGFQSEADKQLYFDTSVDKTLETWKRPPILLRTTSTGAVEESAEPENAFAHSSTGMMAQFAIAGLMGAATILVLERKNMALKRLLTTPISKAEILLGHYLAMVVMIMIQLIGLIIFGQLLLDLNYIGSPLATLILVIATALFTASLGLLIGALAKTEEQVVVLSLIPMFVLAGLGGAWVPLEITPEAFQTVAYFTPLAWVVEGFKDIIIRGHGVEDIAMSVLVLVAYTVLLFAIAVWRFRFD